jgi:hypothetical protein
MTPRRRFQTALDGAGLAFAPLVWRRLPALVHQEQADWWQDPTTGRRLIADAAALARADAMFVFVAEEAVARAVGQGPRGDAALDSLARTPAAVHGVELVQCLHDVADHATIAAVPTPGRLLSELDGDEIEAAEDAFSDLASAYLRAGADALAVTGARADEIHAGVSRAAELGKLYGRPVLGICLADGDTQGWDQHGAPLGVISSDGTWPADVTGVVITPGDVSGRWDADQLRAVGTARP